MEAELFIIAISTSFGLIWIPNALKRLFANFTNMRWRSLLGALETASLAAAFYYGAWASVARDEREELFLSIAGFLILALFAWMAQEVIALWDED